MTLVDVREQDVTVQLSAEEVSIINNALNEVCHGIDIPEFRARIGAVPGRVRSLRRDIGVAIGQMMARSGG